MARRTVHRLTCLVTLLAMTSSAEKEQSRWSRSYTSDISDWMPLSGPVERESSQPPQTKRQAVAEPRILTEPFPTLTRPTGFGHEPFPSRTYYNSPANRQLYLQSVPSVPTAPQNYLTEKGFGQSIRFGLSQPNYPLTQGFVAPPFAFEGPPPAPPKPRTQPVPPSPINFPPSNGPAPPQAKPFRNQPLKKPDLPKFVDGYRAENMNGDKKKPQSLQKIKFDNTDNPQRSESIQQNTKVEREEVQLLYVPLESLNRGQFNFRSPLSSPQILNSELYSQNIHKSNSPKPTYINDYQRPPLKPAENFQGQNYFSDFSTQFKDVDQVPKFSTASSPFPPAPPTTAKPKKLKPHQPPLAIFMTKETAQANQVKVGDVLSSLKNAETIAVLDSVNPLNAPKVFIGPSNLPPPENFVKFELPYLSNIEHSDKKLKQLPFFVAPLSYNTPQGFAKIPFPSPHVGSVVINSLIRENSQTQAPPRANIPNTYISNTYTATAPTYEYKPELKPTQKPSFSYFSTATPNEKPISNYQSNYYSFEPQSVSTIRPAKQPEIATPPPKTGSYFLSNIGSQYNSNEYVNIPQQDNFKSSEAIDALPPAYNIPRQPERTTTLRTTTTTTTTTPRPPSTYPSQLLETHNPYSINQAFHFSTPLDYHSYLDEGKQPFATPGPGENTPSHTPSPISPSTPPPTTPKPEERVTEKPKSQQQSTPVYLQNYNPEIHYNSKEQSWRYPVFNPNDYIEKTEITSQQTQPTNPVYTDVIPSVSSFNTEHNQNIDTQTPTLQDSSNEIKQTVPEVETPTRYDDYQYETNYESTESPTTPVSTTTTTRRPTFRTRGRPRSTTTSRPESYDSATRTIVTRRPLRERRPLPTRPRYEPNRITTERPKQNPLDSYETTTKSTRTRTRGRIQYRPSENEDIYDRRIKTHSKEQDLAYQRDVLHQNYPVTLMERTSTVDIDAITEPTPRLSSTKIQEPITETIDTENAYTNERVSISQHVADVESKPEPSVQTFTSRTTVNSDTSYFPKMTSAPSEEYLFQPRSSVAPVHTSTYDEQPDQDEDIYVKHTTSEQKLEKAESNSYLTESVTVIDQDLSNHSVNDEFSTLKQEETTTSPETEETKIASTESHESEEENVVQTTPSYNRVRVRPGVIRQYYQSSTESPRTKERRRQQVVTYRPAFDRRRTTVRIDEIEAGLMTKQVHSRPDFHDNRHPVYKHEPTTELSSTTETSTKRGQFRRRRPSNSYTTTSTEASSKKRIYEVKNRFRGRRPTEKPTEKPEIETEAPTSTVRSSLHTRYSHRPRLSERYNKKPEPEPESEDQESNFSINRPKYVEPNTDQWSPKISSDTFKPYNPNNIVDDHKVATTERRSDKDNVHDIITARNEYDEVLISVTPASNRLNKKMPDIPPTLEALVEQAKVTKSDSGDAISTFESMLEEVMKSLEEQDKDEYSTSVVKHKGGEIGEIPPERIISSGDNYNQKSTTIGQQETTTEPAIDDSALLNEEDDDRKVRRRGFWKKVKVRPVTTESIEFAESQYYTNTVNQLGQPLKPSKTTHDKSGKEDKPKVTTYKPSLEFIKELFDNDYDTLENIQDLSNVDIRKINSNTDDKDETLINEESQKRTVYVQKEPETDEALSPGDLDLGTGSPDPTLDDLYFTTESATVETTIVDRSDGFRFMDYLFGVTSEDNEGQADNNNKTVTNSTEAVIQITTEQPKTKQVTTETTFMPEEITGALNEDPTENIPDIDIKKSDIDENDNRMDENTEISVVKDESSSVSSFMNLANVVSTSMSTEVSHETEICFRGKCIKTNRDIL